MDDCTILLLGPPMILAGGRPVSLRLRKAIALLAYLAVERRPFSREYLATLLWPDLGPEDSLADLRRTLSTIRTTVGADALTTAGDLVELNRDHVAVDIDRFHHCAEQAFDEAEAWCLDEACSAYRGPFLEGFGLGDCDEFDSWQSIIRSQLESELEDLLQKAAALYVKKRDPRSARAYGIRWLRLDPLNEAAHRMLMEIHAQTGNRGAAIKQFEKCVRLLDDEGLEPDEQTTSLRDTILNDHHGAGASAAVSSLAEGPDGTGSRAWLPRWLRWALAITVGGIVIGIGVDVGAQIIRKRITGTDLAVNSFEVLTDNGSFSSIVADFGYGERFVRRVRYNIVFMNEPDAGVAHQYLVYAGRTFTRATTVEAIDGTTIDQYVGRHSVPIPEGTYVATVVIDPDMSIRDGSRANNSLSGGERFYYRGAADTMSVAVVVSFEGAGALDSVNPIRLLLAPATENGSIDSWRSYRIDAEDTYYLLPDDVAAYVEGVPTEREDGSTGDSPSGYWLVVLHDVGADAAEWYPGSANLGTGDVSALYRPDSGQLVFGNFRICGASRLVPGQKYSVVFDQPLPPSPDAFEDDSHLELGTLIDYNALPIRQYHTFHDTKTDYPDADWFRVYLEPGDTIQVDAFPSGGSWEVATTMSLNDPDLDYVVGSTGTSPCTNHTRLEYTNETGIGKMFRIEVKPHEFGEVWRSDVGEYVVEFRR